VVVLKQCSRSLAVQNVNFLTLCASRCDEVYD
jgi:hypothetical protein